MIGWKCKYGYYKLSTAPNTLTKDDPNIVYTDDGYFTIGTKVNDDTVENGISFSTYLDVAKHYRDKIGNDFDTIYGTPYFYYYQRLSAADKLLVTEMCPSYQLMCPNLFNVWVPSLADKGINFAIMPIIYIPGLNRIFLSSQRAYNATTGQDLGEYDSAGNRPWIAKDNPLSLSYPFVLDYDGTIYSLAHTSKLYMVTLSRSSSRFGTITGRPNTLFKLLFSDPEATLPDYNPGGTGPYEPGGDSGPGDLPPGTFDDTSDPIPDSPLPTISAADTGFTRIYNPTLSQVQALARYLWTEPSILDTIWNHIKQFFEDPMQAIIGFNLVPCPVPDGETKNFALMFIDTGVQMTTAASQFVDVDCGIFELERYYGSALDQNPYTKVSCYLPYIGTVHLNTDEVMGTTLQVKYRIDIVSGSCVAKIFVDGSVLYQYSGHCAINIPISAADFSSYVSAAIGVGTALAGMAVGAAAGGAVAAGSGVVQSTGVAAASGTTALATTESSVPAVIGPHEFAAQQLAYMSANQPPSVGGTQASFCGLDPESVVNTVGQTMGGKMQVEHSGAFSGNSGYLGVRRPFLIIERPNMCLPATYGQLNGYPSMITLELGECQGFTRVQQVQLTGCTATNPEQSEILQLLKSGVIL